MQEQGEQLTHFDALDTKAGALLAFDGVLTTGDEITRLSSGATQPASRNRQDLVEDARRA